MDIKKLVIGIVGVVAAVAISLAPAPEGLDVVGMRTFGILVCAIIWWVGNVLNEAMTAILMCAGFVAIAGIPVSTAFSAFSGATIWLVITAIGLGLCLKFTGVLERVSILLLMLFPKGFVGRVIGLFATTFAVSPFVPSKAAKVVILGPLTRGISESSGYEGESKQAHGLFFAFWSAIEVAPAMFVTASVVTAALVGMLPAETQAAYGWGSWVVSSLPFVVPFVIMIVAFIAFFYRDKSQKGDGGASAEYLKQRYAELGAWSRNEKIMCITTVICVLLWVLKPFGVPEWCVAALALFVGFLTGSITVKQFRCDTPWENIIFVGCAISLSSVLTAAGIIDWLTVVIGPLTAGFFGNPFVAMLTLGLATILLRFVVVSETGYLALATAVFIPLGMAAGINPWVVAFILNVFVVVWFLPYECSLIINTQAAMGPGFVKYSTAGVFCVFYCVIAFIALFIATAIWSGMGIWYM